jgi:acetyl esterase/lipase
LPAAATLMSPTVDLTSSGASMTERADQDPISTPAMLRQFAAGYPARAAPLLVLRHVPPARSAGIESCMRCRAVAAGRGVPAGLGFR